MGRPRTETDGAVRRSPWTDMWTVRAPPAVGEACEHHNILRLPVRARFRLLVRGGPWSGLPEGAAQRLRLRSPLVLA